MAFLTMQSINLVSVVRVEAIFITESSGPVHQGPHASLHGKMVFLRDTFKQNGYNDWQIRRALNCHSKFWSTRQQAQLSCLPAFCWGYIPLNQQSAGTT
jgi:hypothetical protein